ncbi:hypothetical protein NEIPOLOT_01972 [Neisseria polysaccharea ATCC 43768]|nr:hypothetical protein NEIPOLOT_01972 [Neisseria polysaccharea ATCC 43768]
MPSEAHHGQSGALRRSFAIPLAQAGWTKCFFYLTEWISARTEIPPCKRSESNGYSNASEQKKADIPARPYRYGNRTSDSDGGILPVILR